MKRLEKVSTLVSMLFVVCLIFTGSVSADVIKGKGWLHAEGSGVVQLQMTGTIEITGHGIGAVYVYGAEHIAATGEGKRTNLPGGGVLFRGYEGSLILIGEKMKVRLIGNHIEFTAIGKGRINLRGQGHYETGDGSDDWAA